MACCLGDTMNLESIKRLGEESPGVWSFPLTILLIVLIVAAADVLFKFLPMRIEQNGWMWIFSTLVTAVIASLVTEKLSMDVKKATISMTLAMAFSILFYRDISSMFLRSPVEAIQSSISNPFIGMAVYTSALAIAPGALFGALLGGMVASIPFEKTGGMKIGLDIHVDEPSVQSSTYERVCSGCGRSLPLDSKFCPFCSGEPQSRPVPEVRFCRLCGSRLKYVGRFCPECGQEIGLNSNTLVYYSG